MSGSSHGSSGRPLRLWYTSVQSRMPAASATVGVSGEALERLPEDSASSFSLPERMFGAIVGIASNIICTCPPRMSVRAPELPL